MGMSKEGTAPRLSRVQGLPFVQRAAIRVVYITCGPQPSQRCHFSLTFSSSSALNLVVNAHFLEMWIQDVVAGELELGPKEGLDHMLLVLQLSADGHCDLANVDPGQCAPGLSRGTTHTCLELRLGTACQS